MLARVNGHAHELDCRVRQRLVEEVVAGMAHVQDLWEKTVNGRRARTARYGRGNRWQARYLDLDGREHTKTFVRKQDAERFLATMTADLVRGEYVNPDAGEITFAEFSKRWLDAQTFGESTREATELRLRLHAEPTLGRHELRVLKPSIVQAWVRGLQDQLAPTYVRTVVTNVSAVLNAAVDDGLIARNPCRAGSVKLPRIDRREIEPWVVEQVAAVIDALPPRYRAVGMVAAGCGLRQGEVFGLRVDDVEFLRHRVRIEQQVKIVRGQLTIGRPKGGKTRAVPLPQIAAVELAEHLRRYPAGPGLVFTSREHKPLNRNYFNPRIWRPALVTAGVEPCRANGMHALRHFYASVLIDAGESVKAVAEYLGHADPGFTLRVYAHLFPSSEDRARRALHAALSGESRDRVTGPAYDDSAGRRPQ